MLEHSYAMNSLVPVERSKGQIRAYLAQAGADGFADMEQGGRAMLAFSISGRNYRIVFQVPRLQDYAKSPAGRDRSQRQMVQYHEQAIRSFWRTILLIVKANSEAIALGVLKPEQAFGSLLMLRDGTTVGERVMALAQDGKVPAAIPMLEG